MSQKSEIMSFWGDICRKVMNEVIKKIILVCSALMRAQLEYCVCLQHSLKRCRQTIGGAEEINRNEWFSLAGFPGPHLALHFCEIISGSYVFCLPNVLSILYFCNLAMFSVPWISSLVKQWFIANFWELILVCMDLNNGYARCFSTVMSFVTFSVTTLYYFKSIRRWSKLLIKIRYVLRCSVAFGRLQLSRYRNYSLEMYVAG